MTFEPFDDLYSFDKDVLTEDFPDYLLPSVNAWIHSVLSAHSMFYGQMNNGMVLNGFLHPLNRVLRTTLAQSSAPFFSEIASTKSLLRNVLSYILQTVATTYEAHELEKILKEGSSAYQVEFIYDTKSPASGIMSIKGAPILKISGSKLTYRVSSIVKKQAQNISGTHTLLAEAWDAYYGISPDDEKTVTRCTDALAGTLRDKYFPNEKRSQLGTILQKIKQDPKKFRLPASTIYNAEVMLDIMKDFSKIRGNHKTGTGRAPTHEEAGFVLHFSIMFIHLLGTNK